MGLPPDMKRSSNLAFLVSVLLWTLSFLATNSEKFPVLPIPLKVPIWLSGNFDSISPKNLTDTLRLILPYYSPIDERGKVVHDIELKLDYDVKSATDAFLRSYEGLIKAQPIMQGYHILKVDDVATFLLNQMKSNPEFTDTYTSPNAFNLPIVLFYAEELPAHKIISDRLGECSLSVLASVAFMDLSAAACDLRPSISQHSNTLRWATPVVKSPYPFTYIFDTTPPFTPSVSPNGNGKLLLSKLSGIVTSAIQSLAVGSLQWRPSHSTDKLYCPIIVLRNSGVDDQKRPVIPNMADIKKWLSSTLLPNQEIVLVSTTHYIDEHPQIAVALANAQMTYAATVDVTTGGGDSGEPVKVVKETEKIPFLDSNLLFHELQNIGDQLLHLLLSQTGYGDVVRDALQLESTIENVTRTAGKIDLARSEQMWKSAAIVPVFVLSDLHIHRDHDEAEIGHESEHEKLPAIQPLLDRDSIISLGRDSSALLVLHASQEVVDTYSPNAHRWESVDISDVSSHIAEGLTKALTGFSAPHTQLLQGKGIVDLTWTHGVHPYGPFGVRLPSEDENEDKRRVISLAAKRTALIARGHKAMLRAREIAHRTSALKTEVTTAFQTLADTQGSSEKLANRLFDLDDSKVGIHFSAKMTKAMPGKLLVLKSNLEMKTLTWQKRLSQVRSGFALKDMQKTLNYLKSLEQSFGDAEESLKELEEDVYTHMMNCFLNFDGAEGSASGGRRKAGGRKGSSSTSGTTRIIYISIAVLGVFVVAFGALRMQKAMEVKAKKRM